MKKVCKYCGRNRKIGKFGKYSRSPDKKNYYCRDCIGSMTKKYSNTPKGKVISEKSKKKWKRKNKKRTSEYNKKYYQKNKDRIAYNKKCRETLISEKSENIGKSKINKDRLIKINPKRK